jgi:hypothetical protein
MGCRPARLKNKPTIKAKLDPIAGQSIQCGRHRKTAILFLRQAFGMGAQSGGCERGLTFAQLIAANAMNEGTPTASPRWCSQPINLTEKSHPSCQACVLDERTLALRPYGKKAQAATARPFAAGKVKAKSIRRNRKC